MASLYKKPVIRKDPKTGERIKTKSQKWWGQFRDANGRLVRKPLAVDKVAAQAMLDELVRKVEREKAGLIDPTDEQRQRPLKEHLKEFKKSQQNQNVSDKQVFEVTSRLEKIFKACKWKFPDDIAASSLLNFLGRLRREGKSAQTYNHYLQSAKQFTRWLVRDGRNNKNALEYLSLANTQTDRRHDRRPLSADEFNRLLEAARTGKCIESIPGGDREMMYKIAAWTGFRKSEIGSLSKRSFGLDAEPPTATVEACYSKRRRRDTQVLHPELAKQIKEWLSTKKHKTNAEPLIPVSGKVPGGTERKTNKMMRLDLEAARNKWIEEAETKAERRKREKSDFLCYKNHAGLYADFHSCRHLFITSLERAGISPKMAQTLARHGDIRLTLGVYTHVELADKTEAIGNLPGPPGE